MTRADRLLVAGNGARGKDHAVAARQRHFRMIVRRDARQRRARLALAAGADRHHLVRRQIAIGIDAAEILHAIEIAGLARDLHQPLHGAADNDNLAVCSARRIGDGFDAGDVGCKRRHRNARRRARMSCFSVAATSASDGERPSPHGIGGIADHGEAALVAQRAQLGFVGRRADQRRRVDLPVAGMQHGAVRRADDQAFDSGIECATVTSSMSNGPSVKRLSERHDPHVDFRARPAPTRRFASISAAVNGVA